jgi:hypothetical protein
MHILDTPQASFPLVIPIMYQSGVIEIIPESFRIIIVSVQVIHLLRRLCTECNYATMQTLHHLQREA